MSPLCPCAILCGFKGSKLPPSKTSPFAFNIPEAPIVLFCEQGCPTSPPCSVCAKVMLQPSGSLLQALSILLSWFADVSSPRVKSYIPWGILPDLTCSAPTCSSGSQDQPPGKGKSPPVLRVVVRLAAAAAQTPVWSCARQQAQKDAPGVKHSTILILSLWGNCFNNLFLV